jgi:uncharacterized protein YfaT (DUF1175 family)
MVTKKGDILVSLKKQTTSKGLNPLNPGDLIMIEDGNSNGSIIFFKSDCKGYYYIEDFRKATEEETLIYHKGIFNIGASTLMPLQLQKVRLLND